MTTPDDPMTDGTLDLGLDGGEAVMDPELHDPEVAEDYAESVGVDPSPDEVEHYKELVGDDSAEPV